MKKHINGQAMTEMLVASVFVLVPLFLIVPIVGKYIDIQQAVISAARYVAWERTVHLPPSSTNMISTGFTKSTPSTMSEGNLKQQVLSRIYGKHDSTFSSNTLESKGLWRYHNGKKIVTDENKLNFYCDNNSTTNSSCSIHSRLYASKVVSGIGKGLQAATSAISWVTGSGDKFDVIHTNGSNLVKLSLTTDSPPSFGRLDGERSPLLETASLTFNGQANVYSMSWSAGGRDHLKKQVQPLVLTKAIGDLLNKVSFKGVTLQDVAAVALMSPEISKDNLNFGHLNLDILPRDRYLSGKSESNNHMVTKELREYPDDKHMSSCNKFGYCKE